MTTLKLYSPLTADIYEPPNLYHHEEYDSYYEDEDPEPFQTLYGGDLVGLEAVIVKGLEREQEDAVPGRGLMEYFYGSPSVDEKVQSIVIEVERVRGELYGVAVCQLTAPLTAEELSELKEYCTGQYADGLGEGFEQRPQKTEFGDLYVHLWQDKNFSIRTTQEMGLEPKKEQSRKSGVKAPVQKSQHKKGGEAR